MNKLTEWLTQPLLEGVELDIDIGDTVLMGRFKNKPVKVKSIDWNEKGDLLINNRPALKFRKMKSDKKLLPTRKPGKDSVSPDADMRGAENEQLNLPNYMRNTAPVPDSQWDGEHIVNKGKKGKLKENKIALRVPGDIKGLYRLFKKNKKKLYIVGGAVRDAILGKNPKYFDLATDAKPDEVLKIAKQGGFKTIEVGKKFGVVIVGGHEIATFRKDIGKGRRPQAVDFSDIQGDVNRRDLTINSLFYDIEKNEVVDLTGGLKDLKAKIIKTVGNPKRRFDEDPLRKLRALRFQAVVGGKMNKETEMALLKNPSLKGVSKERIREEFVKAIQKGKSSKLFMEACDKFGFTKQIFPGLKVSKPYPKTNDYQVFIGMILRKNEPQKIGKILNQLKYSSKEAINVMFLNLLQNFKGNDIYMYKKYQEKASLVPNQIILFGKLIGKDFKKFVNFKLSVKGTEFVGLKGREIGNAIRNKEAELYNENVVPSPSRTGINKNKTDSLSGYKKVEEILTSEDIALTPAHLDLLRTSYQAIKYLKVGSPAYRKLVKFLDKQSDRTLKQLSKAKINILSKLATSKLKNENVNERAKQAVSGRKVHRYITGFNLKHKGRRYKEIDFELVKIDNKTEMVTLKILAPKKFFGQKVPVKFRTLRRGPFMKTDTSKKVNEAPTKIKKIVGVYGGRFQPFGPHHKKTYEWLKRQVDDAYITTSNIKKPPRHPMDFREKVRHMVKMGIPKNRIIQEKSPYIASNVIKKYDKDTTAIVYIFGEKDAGRLKGGKYFQDYKKNKNNLEPAWKHGYVLEAPHVSMNIGGKEISGTTMRNILGSPKIDDENRPKVFKKLFGYFNQGNYNMMTNKFKKLFEFYNQSSVKNIIKEVSALGAHFDAGILDDEGLYDFFNDFDDYKRVSPKHAEILAWQVIGDIVNYERAINPAYDFQYVQDRVNTTTFGKTINQKTSNEDSVDNPFPKYRAHMTNMADKLGWEIVKFFGKPTSKIGDSPTIHMKHNPNGVNKVTKVQEGFIKDVNLLLEGGAYGHMSHPFDDNNLTFSDLKQIIINGLGGKLDREDNVTEKLDGQNLMVSWVDGKLRAARNKGHLKNHGKTAPTTAGIKSMFSGRGDIEKAFVGAMKNLEKAIGSLSEKQKEKVFGNGKRWMNLEVMYPKTANVIDYDIAEIVFHGTLEYDESGRAIGQPKDSARMLQGMIKQMNQHIQSMFRIGKPNFLKVPKHQDFGKMKNKFLGRLKKLQSQYRLKDNDRLGDYHQAYWREYVFNASKQFKFSLKPDQFVKLVNRWAYFDKSYKIQNIKKDFGSNPKFLDWILSTDKNDHQKIWKDNIKPFEILFFEVGAEILKNIQGFIAASPEVATQKIRKEVTKALNDLKSGGNVEKLKKLKIQIEKLNAIGGLNAVVPSEGIVFKYKGKIYKFTGAFAPINQILGSIKFG